MAANSSGRIQAIGAVAGSVATLGYMYVVGKKTKSEEGSASMFKKPGEGAGLANDTRISSKDVRPIVQGQKKP
ncbi:unnamed protein product [Somion occarium]|uniref:Uncharacterized protein n=1 Tax=Somion occarium TaxID=3059160 RepID=A0ABP1CUE8_9APHY